MRPAIISTCSAAALAILGWALPIVFSGVDPMIARSMLWVAAALLLVTIVLWFIGYKSPGETAGSPVNQSTSGPGSPTFGTLNGPVTMHFGHSGDAPQNLRDSKPRGYDPERLSEGISKAIERLKPPAHVSALPAKSTRPNIALEEVGSRALARLLADQGKVSDKRHVMDKLALTIMDEIVNAPLVVWGRQGNRAIEQLEPSFLRGSVLNVPRAEISKFIGHSEERTSYTDIQFVRAEIDRIWPEEEARTDENANSRGLVSSKPEQPIDDMELARRRSALEQLEKFVSADVDQLYQKLTSSADESAYPRRLVGDIQNIVSFARSSSIVAADISKRNEGVLERLEIDAEPLIIAIRAVGEHCQAVFNGKLEQLTEGGMRVLLRPLGRANNRLADVANELLKAIRNKLEENDDINQPKP